MTTCTPLKPFRCWQYRKDSTEPVPEWVQVRFLKYLDDGDWCVEDGDLLLDFYTPAEFAERFEVIE
jgi:hypothetical protein